MSAVLPPTALVTGATSGIGEVTAQELARRGHIVLITARDRARGEATLAELRALNPAAPHALYVGDLSVMADVRRIALEVCAAQPRLDVLVNNAGGVFVKREVTAEGFERTLALNHLAYALMTGLLLGSLRAAGSARIVSVASDAHRSGRVHWSDPGYARGYLGFRAYSQSKLMNVMFAFALARRLAGSGVTSTALHPGVVRSGFWDHASGVVRPVFAVIKRFGTISAEEGAKTSMYLATSPEVQGVTGVYFASCRPAPTTPAARDEAAQERLWAMTQGWLAPWLEPEAAAPFPGV